jgi:hypothetical protein
LAATSVPESKLKIILEIGFINSSTQITAVIIGGVRSKLGLGPTMIMRGLGPTMTMRGLGPTMTVQGQSIGISIGMLPQTLIVSRLDQLSRLGARI